MTLFLGMALLIAGHDGAYTADDTRAAIAEASDRHGVSAALLDCIVRHESRYDPYAIGRAAEQGSVQLHPRGRLPDFLRRGYGSAFNPFEAVDYLAVELAAGRGGAWSTYRGCL